MMPLRTLVTLPFSWQAAMFEGVGLLGLVAQLGLPGPVEGALQLGALGILGYAVYRLFGVIDTREKAFKADREAQKAEREAERVEQRAERDSHLTVLNRICERWDAQEQRRREDVHGLANVVTQLQVHCAERLARWREERAPANGEGTKE